LWSLSVFHLLSGDAAQRWLAIGGGPAAGAAVALATLPAAFCLGATLPAIGQGLARGSRTAAAWLYALNTAGGAVGIAAAGFGLPALIGVRASYVAVAAGSALAGGVALMLAPRGDAPPADATVADVTPPHRGRLRLLAAGTGAMALGLEVIWTRLFAQVLHNSVYSFAAVALVYVVALASGAAVAALALRRHAARAVAAAGLLAAAAAAAGGFWVFVWWTDGLAYVGMHSSWANTSSASSRSRR
jgi:spermidine synthase